MRVLLHPDHLVLLWFGVTDIFTPVITSELWSNINEAHYSLDANREHLFCINLINLLHPSVRWNCICTHIVHQRCKCSSLFNKWECGPCEIGHFTNLRLSLSTLVIYKKSRSLSRYWITVILQHPTSFGSPQHKVLPLYHTVNDCKE